MQITDYNHNLEELSIEFTCRKDNIVRYLKKHFIEKKDYVKINQNVYKKQGGRSQNIYKLTEETFTLILNSYNLKNTNIFRINNINLVHPIIMSIEKATISFIEKSLINITETNREFRIGSYRIDLYLPKYRIAIECDEYDHEKYDKINEINREKYIKDNLNCIFIRYDPTSDIFDLSKVINLIFTRIIKKK